MLVAAREEFLPASPAPANFIRDPNDLLRAAVLRRFVGYSLTGAAENEDSSDSEAVKTTTEDREVWSVFLVFPSSFMS